MLCETLLFVPGSVLSAGLECVPVNTEEVLLPSALGVPCQPKGPVKEKCLNIQWL